MSFTNRQPTDLGLSFVGFAAWLLVLGFVAATAQADDQEICLRYPVETVDSGLGVDFEDYYALNDTVWPYWKSRGAAYQVLHPDTLDVIQQGYASDVNGCFTIADADMPASDEIVLVFYLDSRLFGDLRIRTREANSVAECNDNPFADHTGEPDYCQPLVCAGQTTPLTGPGKKYLDYFCGGSEGTLQALGAFPAYWWHHFDPAALDYQPTITLRHRDGCQNSPYPPCSNAVALAYDHIETAINIDDQTEQKYRQKFLVGHEVGHAIEQAYQKARFADDDYLNGSYLLADDPACGSAGELHALTSREYVSAAIAEGFAHFVSADAYNDHSDSTGRFTYYKDDLGFPRDIALEGEPAFDMGSPHRSNRYFERVCTATASNAGTELDWLRFFWDLHSGGGADGEHENLLVMRVDAAYQGTNWGNQNGYHLLEDNVCNGPAGAQLFQAEFLQYAGSDDGLGGNGVEPDGMVPGC
ncbi:MAG: hypothetical protein AAGC60_10170 [Acidobacteriota bacterium]